MTKDASTQLQSATEKHRQEFDIFKRGCEEQRKQADGVLNVANQENVALRCDIAKLKAENAGLSSQVHSFKQQVEQQSTIIDRNAKALKSAQSKLEKSEDANKRLGLEIQAKTNEHRNSQRSLENVEKELASEKVLGDKKTGDLAKVSEDLTVALAQVAEFSELVRVKDISLEEAHTLNDSEKLKVTETSQKLQDSEANFKYLQHINSQMAVSNSTLRYENNALIKMRAGAGSWGPQQSVFPPPPPFGQQFPLPPQQFQQQFPLPHGPPLFAGPAAPAPPPGVLIFCQLLKLI